ncbi:unnamed protein product [Effrenium voratum]|nr:unnamed protein product [Effrenium voratum]
MAVFGSDRHVIQMPTMRRCSSHGGSHAVKHRKACLRQLDYLEVQFPTFSLEGARQRLQAEDVQHQLRQAFAKGDAERLPKLLALAQSHPGLAGTELVTVVKKSMRQILLVRKLLKAGQICLPVVPWEYPADQVDFNLGVLRSSQLGMGIWDDELLAKAKIMKDSDLLKLLRSIRPLNDDGSAKTRFDMERCTKAWLALTETGIIGEHVSRMILHRLCECGNAGVALASALTEPWFLWRFDGDVHVAFLMDEFWKAMWNNGHINKATDLKILPVLSPLEGLEETKLKPKAKLRQLLLKGPPDVLRRAHDILRHTKLGEPQFSLPLWSAAAEAARVATILRPADTALPLLCRQGLLTAAAKQCPAGGLGAVLQSCARNMQLSWEPKEDFPLAHCLATAADVLREGKKPRYSRQQQAEIKSLLSECAAILEDRGQLMINA